MRKYGREYIKRYSISSYIEHDLTTVSIMADKELAEEQLKLVDECEAKIDDLIDEYQEKIFALDPLIDKEEL